MTKLSNQVREFMVSFGQHIAETPSEPPDDVIRLRLRLVVEECFELLAACTPGAPEVFADLKRETMVKISAFVYRVDMVEFTDALADLDYVIEGARLAFGINGEPIADTVHAANMAKVGGYRDEHGKWRKPAGWQAPDILGELRKQGWAQ